MSFTRGEERSLEEGFYLADSLMQSIKNLEVIAAERGGGGGTNSNLTLFKGMFEETLYMNLIFQVSFHGWLAKADDICTTYHLLSTRK